MRDISTNVYKQTCIFYLYTNILIQTCIEILYIYCKLKIVNEESITMIWE